MHRRQFLRAAAVSAAAAPFAIVHELARQQPTEKLPHVKAGESIWTANKFNALIDKVNALSER